MKNFPYAIAGILLLFLAFTFAGFKGWLKPKHQTKWETWLETNSAISIRSNVMPTNAYAAATDTGILEMGRRAATAGLAMGIHRHNEGYEALSNEIWQIYMTTKP